MIKMLCLYKIVQVSVPLLTFQRRLTQTKHRNKRNILFIRIGLMMC